jgi:hypothetical protein
MHFQHAFLHLYIQATHKLGSIILVMNFMSSHWPFLKSCQRGTIAHGWNVTTCMSMFGARFPIYHALTQLDLEGLQVL